MSEKDDCDNRTDMLVDDLRQDLLASEIAGEIDFQRRFGALKREVSALQRQVANLQRYTRHLAMSLEWRTSDAEGATFDESDDHVAELAISTFLEDPASGDAGVILAPERNGDGGVEIDCADRIAVCRAACCWLSVPLTRSEVLARRHQIDAKAPFYMRRTTEGKCPHLDNNCKCSVYADRPAACRNYQCSRDKRIWRDFTMKIPGPLPRKLTQLEKENISEEGGDAVGKSGQGESVI